MDPSRPFPLRILAAFRTLFYAPLHVAHRLGTFAEEGLDVRIAYTPQASETPDRLLAGEADLAVTGPMRTYVAADRATPLRLVNIAEVNSRDGFFLLARRPPERFSWPDLVGKRVILFAEAPTPFMCLLDVLRRQGVDPQRIAFVDGLWVPDALEALHAGEADYLQTAQPMAEELIQEGAAYLAAAMGEAVGHIPYTAFVVTSEFLGAQPGLCRRAVMALARAQRWMAGRDPQAIANLIAADFPEIHPRLVAQVVARYQALGTWPRQPVLAREPFERLGRILAEGGLIRRVVPYETVVDNTFAEEAVRSLGA
jgi:NitT/TauT family transport system substrate-binding protein